MERRTIDESVDKGRTSQRANCKVRLIFRSACADLHASLAAEH